MYRLFRRKIYGGNFARQPARSKIYNNFRYPNSHGLTLFTFRDHIQKVKQTTDIPIMIAGNKSDLDSDRQVDKEKVLTFAKEKLGGEKMHIETSGICDTVSPYTFLMVHYICCHYKCKVYKIRY